VFTERFFRSLKYEEVYPKEYWNPKEAGKGTETILNFMTTKVSPKPGL